MGRQSYGGGNQLREVRGGFGLRHIFGQSEYGWFFLRSGWGGGVQEAEGKSPQAHADRPTVVAYIDIEVAYPAVRRPRFPCAGPGIAHPGPHGGSTPPRNAELS